jgi:glycolate oxidase FAD binding subunit
VTGYDLHKLLIGSLGTLAVITRLNFRTFPMPQAQGMFAASFSSAENAFDFCRAVSHSVLTPQIMEIADPEAAGMIFSGEIAARLEPKAWIAIAAAAGAPAVVERHQRELPRLADASYAGDFLPLPEREASSILANIREFPRRMVERDSSVLIFRIDAEPGVMAALVEKLGVAAGQNALDFASLSRAVGILYAAFVPTRSDAAQPASRPEAIAEVFQICGEPEIQASAMLEWCPAELKTSADIVWGPPRPDFELMRRVKQSFDPQNVLAPGRFAGGI